ncbi:MAG: hypothetical protein M3R27_09365 [Bacteroidota bacterium]|nr:hypothetical protein [Bacteroidota bacterium]
MKNFSGFFFLTFFILLFSGMDAFAISKPGTGNNSIDSTASIKSNIVIFKMITSPSNSISNSNGSLKKAGKVARTSSNPHSYIKPLRPVSNEG